MRCGTYLHKAGEARLMPRQKKRCHMTDNMTAFKVKANSFEFELNTSTLDAVDILQKSPTEYHVLHQHTGATATIVDCDPACKHLKVEVNGELFDVEVKDSLDVMLDKMGFKTVSTKQIKEIKAPMPGLVVEVVVQEGQEVAEGDKLLILSAMKMENSIMIQTPAIIKKINVKAGDAVDKGQIMIELE